MMSIFQTSSSAVAETVEACTSVTGAVEAVADAPGTVSNLFLAGAKLFYGAGYLTTFAIVFPVALICAAIPKRNALVQGIIEGSLAAQDRAHGWTGQ